MAVERCCLARLTLPSADQHITQRAAANSDSHRTRTVVPALHLTRVTTITDLYCRLTGISLQPFRKWTISREASGLAKKKQHNKTYRGGGMYSLNLSTQLHYLHGTASSTPQPIPFTSGQNQRSSWLIPACDITLLSSRWTDQSHRNLGTWSIHSLPEVWTLHLKYKLCTTATVSPLCCTVSPCHCSTKLWLQIFPDSLPGLVARHMKYTLFTWSINSAPEVHNLHLKYKLCT